MNLFSQHFITHHQTKLLFLVIWAHVTILNLFYVTYTGPIFFWQQSLQIKTLIIHVMVACLTLLCYVFLTRIGKYFGFSKVIQLPHQNNALKTTQHFNKDTSY